MTTNENRPALAGTGAAQEAVGGADTTIADPGIVDAATRPRCTACQHPLTAPRSVARAYGPECWRRTAVAQLDTRRDAVGRSLAALARRVGRLDAPGLAVVADALADLDALAGLVGDEQR